MASTSLTNGLSLSAASLHHLMAACPIKLKPNNYLIWRTRIYQLMQVMKVTKLVHKDKPKEVAANGRGDTEKDIDTAEKVKAADTN